MKRKQRILKLRLEQARLNREIASLERDIRKLEANIDTLNRMGPEAFNQLFDKVPPDQLDAELSKLIDEGDHRNKVINELRIHKGDRD